MQTSLLHKHAISIVYVKNYLLLLLVVLGVSTVGVFFRPAAQAMITELTPSGSLVMVTAILIDSVRVWVGLLGGARKKISTETPFVASVLMEEA